MYINSDLPGLSAMYQMPGKPMRGFVQRLKGKQVRGPQPPWGPRDSSSVPLLLISIVPLLPALRRQRMIAEFAQSGLLDALE